MNRTIYSSKFIYAHLKNLDAKGVIMKSHIKNLFKFLSGFLGWYLVASIYWISLYRGFDGPEAMILLFCGFPPIIITMIAFASSMPMSSTRWIGIGLVSALLFNSTVIIILSAWRGQLEYVYLLFYMNIPFPIQFFLFPFSTVHDLVPLAA